MEITRFLTNKRIFSFFNNFSSFQNRILVQMASSFFSIYQNIYLLRFNNIKILSILFFVRIRCFYKTVFQIIFCNHVSKSFYILIMDEEVSVLCEKKNVYMENYLPRWGLQILIKTFLDRMYILCFDFKYRKNSIFFTKICEIRNKRCSAKCIQKIEIIGTRLKMYCPTVYYGVHNRFSSAMVQS